MYLGKNAAKKYVAVLMDFERVEIVDIICGRTKYALRSCLQRIPLLEREKVQSISAVMVEGFRFLQHNYLKRQKLCVDSFHVIQIILTMFDKQIKKIINQLDRHSINYYLLKNKRKFLLQNEYRVNWSERKHNRKFGYTIANYKLRELIFDIYPLLKQLYELKEEYFHINGSIESRNNMFKLVIRNGATYRNFDNRRLRVKYCINQKKK